MKLSEKGLSLITQFEGLKTEAYKSFPSEKYYTIGYGHCAADIKKGMVITEPEALEYLKKDVERFEKHVSAYDKTYHFTQNQFDALVSFAYNIGSITQLTQKGTRTITSISNNILLYVNVNGKYSKGLYKRRMAEKELFDTLNKKTIHEVALEVVAGKWGNGNDRKLALIKQGYSYEAVQKEVNLLMRRK